jgi:hypothetical protein
MARPRGSAALRTRAPPVPALPTSPPLRLPPPWALRHAGPRVSATLHLHHYYDAAAHPQHAPGGALHLGLAYGASSASPAAQQQQQGQGQQQVHPSRQQPTQQTPAPGPDGRLPRAPSAQDNLQVGGRGVRAALGPAHLAGAGAGPALLMLLMLALPPPGSSLPGVASVALHSSCVAPKGRARRRRGLRHALANTHARTQSPPARQAPGPPAPPPHRPR